VLTFSSLTLSSSLLVSAGECISLSLSHTIEFLVEFLLPSHRGTLSVPLPLLSSSSLSPSISFHSLLSISHDIHYILLNHFLIMAGFDTKGNWQSLTRNIRTQ
jgi:hypothetical protein